MLPNILSLLNIVCTAIGQPPRILQIFHISEIIHPTTDSPKFHSNIEIQSYVIHIGPTVAFLLAPESSPSKSGNEIL